MDSFPQKEPKVSLVQLDEPAGEIECPVLRWWFVAPLEGEHKHWATYEYPDWHLKKTEEMEVTGRGKLYGEECFEMRYREHQTDGAVSREAYAYGAVRDGIARWFGWWNLSDEEKIYTWRDEDFPCDWAGSPARIADIGQFTWSDHQRVRKEPKPWDDPKIDPIGAGMWLLRIGGTEHRCLRVIEVAESPESATHVLCEGFVDFEGRLLLFRRYNAADYSMDGGSWDEKLRGSPTLTVNDTIYYLWYDCLAEEGL